MQKSSTLFVICLLCAGCNFPGFKATKNYNWSFDGSDPIPVDVESVNGAITVTGSKRDEIELDAIVTTRGFTQESADAALEKYVPTAVVEDGKVIARMNSSSSFSNVNVEFVLRVPEKTFARLHTSNGSIRVEKLSGEVDCSTSNGAVQIDGVTGQLKVKTSNGSIKIFDTVAEVTAKTSNGTITANFVPVGGSNELRTSNGRVHIGLPTSLPVALDISTSNGSVSCEIPLDDDAKWTKTSLIATTKTEKSELAKATLLVRTSNGSVQVREMDRIELESPEPSDAAEVDTPSQIEL